MNPLAFLVPAFLAGLATLAIPVLVHLRHKERREPVRFPSLMFLRRIPFREVRRQQIHHWPLFLLRCLAVALLVLAFARPFFRGDDPPIAAAGAQGREVVVVLDRSASMAYGSRWTRAVDAARQVVDRLGRDDRGAVILFEAQATLAARPTQDRTLLRAAIDGAQPGAGTTRYAPAIRAAAEVLTGTFLPRREVVLVSDFQRTGWRGEDLDPLPEGTVLTRVDVGGGGALPNLAIASAEVTPSPVGGRPRITVRARVTGTGLAGPVRTRATLELDGRAVESRELTLAGDGAQTVGFRPAELGPGTARGIVRLDPADSLAADDAYRFVASGDRPLRVLLVQTGGAMFLSRALTISRSPRVELTVQPSLRVQDLETADVVFLDDVPYPPGEPGRRLASFVRGGGGLIITVGNGAGGWPADLIPARATQTVDRAADGGARLGALRREHPLFEPFRGPRSGDFGATRVWRYRRLEGDSLEVLARHDDASPALIEAVPDRGRVLLWASALDNAWSDLPLQPVFLPLVHQLALYASGYVERSPAWAVGDVATLGADQVEGAGAVVVLSPSGDRTRREPQAAGPLAIALDEGGFWEVREGRSGGRLLATLAANVPAEEGRLEPFDPDDLRLATGAVDSAGASPRTADLTPQESERRQGLWWYVLAVVTLLLAAETVVANRRPGMVRVPGVG